MAKAPSEDPIVAEAISQAEARSSVAEAAAESARELAELASLPMGPINRATHDVIGRELPDDLDASRAQQREAVAIRQGRVDVDVARAQRGLPPKYATE